MSGKQLVYNSKHEADLFYETQQGLTLQLKNKTALAGDIVIELKDSKSLGTNLVISYVFNTAFVQTDT